MIDTTKPLEVVIMKSAYPATFIGYWYSLDRKWIVVGHRGYGYDYVSLFDITGAMPDKSFTYLRNVAPKPVTHTHYLVWYKNSAGMVFSACFSSKAEKQSYAESLSHLLKVEEISITV